MTRVIESTFNYQRHLNAGWNFFSLPGHPVDGSVGSVLSGMNFPQDIEQVSRFNALTDTFEHYVGREKFNQFEHLEYGKGYEVYVTKTQGVDLNLTGLATYDDVIPLESGWNLVGAPQASSVTVASLILRVK